MGIRLTFTDTNSAEDGYNVYRHTSSIAGLETAAELDPYLIAELPADATGYDDGGALDGQTYYYRVATVSGGEVYPGAEIQITASTGSSGDIIGVVLVDTDVKGGNLVHIDENGDTITSPASGDWDTMYPWSDMVDETIDGQAMVKVPKFYYRRGPISGGEHDGRDAWWISPEPATGFTVHPAFVLAGGEVDQFWYGKYQGSIDGESKLASVAGVTPSTDRSITEYFDDAEARNVSGVEGFRVLHADMVSAVQWMALIEAASFDSQTAYGTGLNSSTSPEDVDSTANQDAAYRGIVGAWGNIYQWIDGLRIDNGNFERRGYEAGSLTTGWSTTGIAPASTSAHNAVTLKQNAEVADLFVADTTAATESDVTIPDFMINNTSGINYALMGGGGTGGYPGLWTLNVNNSATSTHSSYGSRLARVV